jgi:hypothetical protein
MMMMMMMMMSNHDLDSGSIDISMYLLLNRMLSRSSASSYFNNCTMCFKHGGELSSMMMMVVVMINDHSAVMQANDLLTTVHRHVFLYLEH